jgi:hypothetical protein
MNGLMTLQRRSRTVIRVGWQSITRAQFWAIYCALESDWVDETETRMDTETRVPYEVTTSRLSDSIFPFLKVVDNRLYFRAEIYEEEE